MSNKQKPKEFRLEIRLGLILIVLLLVILDFAAYYTLYRVGNTVEIQTREELTEAAVIVSNSMTRLNKYYLPSGLEQNIEERYSLSSLNIIHLDYNRIITIKNENVLDSTILAIDSTLVSGELINLLANKPIYRHESGSDSYQLLFPTEYAGSNYLVILSKPSSILGPIESAMRILVFFGFLTAIVIVFISIRLVHTVLYPFDRLKEEAEKTGHFDKNNEDEVGQLIGSYEKIIHDLRTQETELVELNKIVTQRAANLEVYNDYILKSINAGIITLDADRNISTINHAAGKICNIEIPSLIGLDYKNLISDYPELHNLINQHYENEKVITNQEIDITSNKGEALVLAVSISPLIDSFGDNIGCVIIINDQTDFIAILKELELNKRMATLGEMSAGLAHQLRNSTAAIVGFARLIEKRASDETSLKNIDYLIKEAMQSEALIVRFLDYARPLEATFETIHLRGFINEIIVSNKQLFPNIDIVFQSDYGKDACIEGDQLLLKQALSNIVDNASKSYDTGIGQITIKYLHS
ncbi:MAG: PAS domain-containing protein, partial [candidate division Zixibacteria bacterium]|nr:PAS domain-containing protein [candidate division Zixibacteria bacterium]